MLKRILNGLLIGAVIGTIAALMTGCAGSVTTFVTNSGLEEPSISDKVIKVGASYAYDTREVVILNPMEQTIAVAVDCRYKDPVELTIEPHKGIRFTMPSSKNLSGPGQCELAWEIAGQGAPIVSRLRRPY